MKKNQSLEVEFNTITTNLNLDNTHITGQAKVTILGKEFRKIRELDKEQTAALIKVIKEQYKHIEPNRELIDIFPETVMEYIVQIAEEEYESRLSYLLLEIIDFTEKIVKEANRRLELKDKDIKNKGVTGLKLLNYCKGDEIKEIEETWLRLFGRFSFESYYAHRIDKLKNIPDQRYVPDQRYWKGHHTQETMYYYNYHSKYIVAEWWETVGEGLYNEWKAKTEDIKDEAV